MAQQQDGTLRSVQALRAVAVGAVVLFHLWPVRLTGGYVGVDVFFVISGYLITSHLVREVDRTGAVRLRAFWARRIRRLLPASLTVLLVVAVALMLLAPVAVWREMLREVMASALYFENWMLAATAVDYLAEGGADSPVTHFWSLSVEEQFYFVWPLIVLAVAVWARRRRVNPRPLLLGAMAVIVAASLLASWWLTSTSPAIAYYATHVRAWEFAAGGVVALAVTATSGASRLRVVGSWAGMAMIVVSTLWFSSATPFPGIAAALPVAGAALVLAAGETRGALSPAPLYRMRWVQWIGDVSYSIYLWHWPLIVLVPLATGHALRTVDKVAIIVATLLLAAATKRWIEDPWRRPRTEGRARYARVYAAAAAGMATVVLVAGSGWTWARAEAAAEADVEARIAELPSLEQLCFGAASADPDLADECGQVSWTSFIPGPTAIGADIPALYGDECETDARSAEVKRCEFGDTGSEHEIALVGDSHAAHWFPALEDIADRNGWRLVTYFKAACAYTAAADRMTSDDYRPTCTEWNADVADALAADPPDLVVVSAVRANRFTDETGEISDQVAIDGYADAWAALVAHGSTVAAMVDTAQMDLEAITCIREATDDGSECGRAAGPALERPDHMTPAAAAVDGATAIDLNPMLCTDDWCPQVIGGAVVYRDRSSHLTQTFVRTLSPYLEAMLPLQEAGLRG